MYIMYSISRPVVRVSYTGKRRILTRASTGNDFIKQQVKDTISTVSKPAIQPIIDILDSIDKRLEKIDDKISKYEITSGEKVVKMVPTEKLKK